MAVFGGLADYGSTTREHLAFLPSARFDLLAVKTETHPWEREDPMRQSPRLRHLKRIAAPVVLIALGIGMPISSTHAGGPTSSVQSEYLMTLHAQLIPPQAIDQKLLIVNITGGWVEGPQIKGKMIGPSGDWQQVMPSG